MEKILLNYFDAAKGVIYVLVGIKSRGSGDAPEI
jgi:hypothetical protein